MNALRCNYLNYKQPNHMVEEASA